MVSVFTNLFHTILIHVHVNDANQFHFVVDATPKVLLPATLEVAPSSDRV